MDMTPTEIMLHAVKDSLAQERDRIVAWIRKQAEENHGMTLSDVADAIERGDFFDEG